MQSTSSGSLSDSNARIHSQSFKPNALVVLASTPGYSRPISPWTRNSSARFSVGSRYQSGDRTNGYTHRYRLGGSPFRNAGRWSGAVSGGRDMPRNEYASSIRLP